MRLAFTKCHGSGNDFPLIDARAIALSDAEWGAVARALADRKGPVGGDGLLLLTEGDGDFHQVGFRMFNSDGSEAETCLNGLRCVARAGFEALGIDSARVKLKTSTAEVAREPELAPGVTTVRTSVPSPSLATADVGLCVDATEIREARIPGLPSPRAFTALAIPNPHLVSFVEAIDEDELVALGEWCEAAPPLIPRRANVSFVTQRPNGLYVRTFERGVGLTDSCGSAMAASVFAAALTGRIGFGEEITVFNKGGLVHGMARDAAAGGAVTISGNATFLYDATIEVDPLAGTAEPPIVHARREDEARAWNEAIAALG